MQQTNTTITITIQPGTNGTDIPPHVQSALNAGTHDFSEMFEASHQSSYFQHYEGYKTNFLGDDAVVELPELTIEQRRAAAKNSNSRREDDAAILPYTHFSIVMNRERQVAFYTAVNIDGTQSRSVERKSDKWYFDGRIAESEQIGEALYKRNILDRGHLVRRLDPVWGEGAVRANDDTFHFTNCTPQHARFNQGQELWQGLENYLLNRAQSTDRKITVFTGPVTKDTDPLYRGVRLPLAYWKLIAYKKNNSLRTAAYLLDQSKLVAEMLNYEANFDPGVYRISITELIELTGLQFQHLKTVEVPLPDDGFESALSTPNNRMDKNLKYFSY